MNITDLPFHAFLVIEVVEEDLVGEDEQVVATAHMEWFAFHLPA